MSNYLPTKADLFFNKYIEPILKVIVYLNDKSTLGEWERKYRRAFIILSPLTLPLFVVFKVVLLLSIFVLVLFMVLAAFFFEVAEKLIGIKKLWD